MNDAVNLSVTSDESFLQRVTINFYNKWWVVNFATNKEWNS